MSSFDPPTFKHHASPRMITRPPLRTSRLAQIAPLPQPSLSPPPQLYPVFLFLEVEKQNKDTHPSMTHDDDIWALGPGEQ